MAKNFNIDKNGLPVTDSSGNPAGNVVGEIAGISGVYKTYYIIADTAANMTDAADHRVDDATGFKAFRVTPVTQIATEELAYGWSTTAADYAALETKLTTVLGQVATPTGAAQEDARIIAEVGDGTATEYFEPQGWINYDGTTTIKTITAQTLANPISVMVEVLA